MLPLSAVHTACNVIAGAPHVQHNLICTTPNNICFSSNESGMLMDDFDQKFFHQLLCSFHPVGSVTLIFNSDNAAGLSFEIVHVPTT
jgi:hypothetical protein